MTVAELIIPVILITIGWAVHDIQKWLEDWDYRRHCND